MEKILDWHRDMKDERILSIKEASDRLGISMNTLYSWVSQRKIEYVKIGRLVKFKQSGIERFIRDHTVPLKSIENG